MRAWLGPGGQTEGASSAVLCENCMRSRKGAHMAERNKRGERRGPSRAEQAKRHIAETDRRHAGEISRAVEETRAYEGLPKASVEGCVPTVSVVDEDSVAAVLARGRGLASARRLRLRKSFSALHAQAVGENA